MHINTPYLIELERIIGHTYFGIQILRDLEIY